jgi:hypothetical protein
MTEDEAKTKWCPMYRITSLEWLQTATNNRGETLHENIPPNCIGSDCMMWTWDVTPFMANNENARGNAHTKASGHCGLAR